MSRHWDILNKINSFDFPFVTKPVWPAFGLLRDVGTFAGLQHDRQQPVTKLVWPAFGPFDDVAISAGLRVRFHLLRPRDPAIVVMNWL